MFNFKATPHTDTKYIQTCGILGAWFPGIFLPGTFCEKMKSAWKGVEVKDTFLPGTFCEKKKSALKGAEVKNTFSPGTYCEKMKSALKGAEVEDTLLPGTFCEKIKSAWKSAEVKELFAKRRKVPGKVWEKRTHFCQALFMNK